MPTRFSISCSGVSLKQNELARPAAGAAIQTPAKPPVSCSEMPPSTSFGSELFLSPSCLAAVIVAGEVRFRPRCRKFRASRARPHGAPSPHGAEFQRRTDSLWRFPGRPRRNPPTRDQFIRSLEFWAMLNCSSRSANASRTSIRSAWRTSSILPSAFAKRPPALARARQSAQSRLMCSVANLGRVPLPLTSHAVEEPQYPPIILFRPNSTRRSMPCALHNPKFLRSLRRFVNRLCMSARNCVIVRSANQ